MKANFSIQMSEIEKKRLHLAIKITVVAFVLQFGFFAWLNFMPGVQYMCCPPFGELQFAGGIWHWVDAILETVTLMAAEATICLVFFNGLNWSLLNMGIILVLSFACASLLTEVFKRDLSLFQILIDSVLLFVLATMLSFFVFSIRKGVGYLSQKNQTRRVNSKEVHRE